MRVALSLSLVAIAVTACTQSAQPAKPTTDDDKALHALGVTISQQFKTFEFTDQELAMVLAGFSDSIKGNAEINQEEWEVTHVPKLQELQRTRVEAAVEAAKKSGAEYVEKAAAESGAEKLPSGMVYKTVQEGTGASPAPTDTVKVHYVGKLINGDTFDSSRERNEPIDFPLNGVIPCWTEGVQKMKVGGTAQLVCPSDLAYGDEGRPPPIPGGSTLLFDVELLEIMKAEPAAE